MPTSIYNKTELFKKNWSQDQIDYFLLFPYQEGDKTGWDKTTVRKAEKLQEFINFDKNKNLIKTKNVSKLHQFEAFQIFSRQWQKNPIQINFDTSLINENIQNRYKQEGRLKKEIIHYPQGQQLNKEGQFKLFVAGASKRTEDKTYSSIGGWIQNDKGEILVEFSKELDNQNADFTQWEIEAIRQGLKLCHNLEIRNLEVITRSTGDSNILNAALNGINKQVVMQEVAYQESFNYLKELNAKIYTVPNEYATHALELSQLHLNPYKQSLRQEDAKEKELVLKKGFDYSLNEISYFMHDKIKVHSDYEDMNIKWFLYLYLHPANKTFYNLLINTETEKFHMVSKFTKEEIFSFYKTFGFTDQQLEAKRNSSESAGMINLLVNLDILDDIKSIGINYLTPGFRATLDKLRPVTPAIKEEHILLHKKMDDFDEVHFAPVSPKAIQDVRLFLREQYHLDNASEKIKNGP